MTGIISAVAILAAVLLGLWFLAHYNVWRPKVSTNYPRVLMYHSVSETDSELAVSPARFAQQLAWLTQQGYQFFTASDLLRDDLPTKAVVLTFDDGFADNYTQMFPILKQFNAKATIYLAPKMQTIERLSVEQIEEMQASGLCEFGAHTMHHVNVSQVPLDEAKAEIEASKAWVETTLGVPCRAFAYPYGRFNDENVGQVKTAGFTTAVTVKKGIEEVTDPYRIKRVSILRSTNKLQFAIAMSRGRYRV